MQQFSLRFLQLAVAVSAVLCAGWLSFPALTSVSFVVLAGVFGYAFARSNRWSIFARWLCSSCAATLALDGCVLWEYFSVVSDDAQLGFSRAIPMSICLGALLGCLVTMLGQLALPHCIALVKSLFRGDKRAIRQPYK